jgi:peptide/nickel transport system substrate-binding protein
VVAWLAWAACQTPSAPKAPADGRADTLVIGASAEVGLLNPVVYAAASDQNVIIPLTVPTIEPRFDCEAKAEPGYARSWSWSEDGKVVSVEVRDDLTWEDGVPVTVDDLVFTFELVADPTVASPRMAITEHMVAGARPKVVDSTHVEFHFDQAFDRATQLAYIGDLGLVPKHVFAGADRATLAGHPKVNAPLSYGPFRLARWDPGQQLVLEPNPKFTGPDSLRPHLARVVWRVLPDYASRLSELERGTIDLMDQVLVADADRLRQSHPELRLVRRGWRTTDYLAWNTRDPLFADREVRAALAEAADVDGMIRKLHTSRSGEAYARRATSTVTPALCGAHNDALVPVPFDPASARRRLEAAGWRDTDRDGVLDRGGRPLTFTLLANAENKRMQDVALLVQANLDAIGVKVEIEPLAKSALYNRLGERQFQAALAGWSASLFVDPSSVWKCETPENPRRFNFTGFCDPEVDRLIDQALATPLAADAAPLWREVQARIFQAQPYLFLYWMDEIVAVSDRFEHASIDLLAPYGRLHEWSVNAGKVKYR